MAEKRGEIEWPEVFTDEMFEYDLRDPDTSKIALIDGFIGWANCYGSNIPEGFGRGMQKIGIVLGISPVVDNLLVFADKQQKKGGN